VRVSKRTSDLLGLDILLLTGSLTVNSNTRISDTREYQNRFRGRFDININDVNVVNIKVETKKPSTISSGSSSLSRRFVTVSKAIPGRTNKHGKTSRALSNGGVATKERAK